MMNSKLRPLLVVEDNPGLQKQLKWAFEGYQVYLAADRESALQQLQQHQPPVVTLDLGLPPDPANASEGLAALAEMLRIAPETKIIVVTGNDDRSNALKAIALGAYDFYQKPVDPEILALIVNRASSLHELEMENRRLAAESGGRGLDGIVCSSPSMLAACRMVEKVGPTDVTALIRGDSGTGKELFARALHQLSSRRNGAFVAVNCAAIPETLLESELFGYEKGAFTGAVRQTPGKIEYADGGTFFLDEIGDMPLTIQAKLLRFLQERSIERLGGPKSIPVDVRCCAPPTRISRMRSGPAGFVKTCITGSARSSSRFHPCGSGKATACCWHGCSWTAMPLKTDASSPALRKTHWNRYRPIPGRAMCANWKTG